LRLKIKNLKFVDDCLGEKVKKEIEKLKEGEAILLENLRFYPQEQRDDKNFAKKLASLADLYINDAFAVCHRKNASVSSITKFLPSYAGFLLEKEVETLSQILERPKKPLIVLLGGVKISTKLPTTKNLLKVADKILIGGALANNFLVAKKIKIGQSIYEREMVKEAERLLENKKIALPVDVKIELNIKNKKQERQIKNIKIRELNKLKNFQVLDIGDETIEIFSRYLKSAKMIVWNGPMGLFEVKPFDQGTKKLAKEILKNKKAKIFIGGGETLAALRQVLACKYLAQIDREAPGKQWRSVISQRLFISTGGGAMIEFLSGKILPGLKPLLIG
jgi:3-phosphoglycerate kinase